jgi:iron(III) transport system permease protein
VASDPFLFRWRVVAAASVGLAIGLPLIAPFLGLLADPAGWQAWTEPRRILGLAGNTLFLAAGTLALALPVGTVAAFLLYRTDLPGRRLWRMLTVLMLFVPLPLFASAWQAALGTGGWLPVAVWNQFLAGDPDVSPSGLIWKPWPRGLGAATWVHAMAALPWVVLIIGQGFTWVERELEEDALTSAGPWRVMWHVTLPRCRTAVAAAALWVVLPIVTEITVTDMMQVRTFAEEVYTQLVVGDRHRTSLDRSVAVTVPGVVLTGVLLVVISRHLERELPDSESRTGAPLVFPLGRSRQLWLATILLAVALLAGIPLASLVWKAGLVGSPRAWSAQVAFTHVSKVFRLRWPLVAHSMELAFLSAGLLAALSLLVCWLMAGSRWFFALILTLGAAAWVMPAPLVGFGLNEIIEGTLRLIRSDLLARWLYYGPSSVPVVWAYLVRFFPFAIALMWPAVRLVPAELSEAARVDGARPGQVLVRVIWPLILPAFLATVLAIAVLSLGELGASKLVETAGSQTFAHEIFVQMHYGVTNDLAALCLVLLGIVALGGAALVAAGHFVKRRSAERNELRSSNTSP